MSPQRKHGITVHSTRRNIIANAMKYCDEEAEQNYLSVAATKATARIAKYDHKA